MLEDDDAVVRCDFYDRHTLSVFRGAKVSFRSTPSWWIGEKLEKLKELIAPTVAPPRIVTEPDLAQEWIFVEKLHPERSREPIPRQIDAHQLWQPGERRIAHRRQPAHAKIKRLQANARRSVFNRVL